MIRSKTVTASDGNRWTIRRRWAPRPRWRGPVRLWGRRRDGKKKSEAPTTLVDWLEFPFRILADGLSLADDGIGAAILVVILFAAFVVFMIFVGVPLLVFLFETLLIIPVLLVVTALVRVLFRRPWTIEGTDGARRFEWKIVGWRASTGAADRMASQITAHGLPDIEPPGAPRAHRRHAR